MFENNPEHYASVRLLYYLFSFALNTTSKQVRIKYNPNIANMKNFITNVIANGINGQTPWYGYTAIPVA